MASLQQKGCTRIASLCSSTAPTGASGVRFVLVPSTSTSGSNWRVPPPRGFPPRCPSLGIPFCFRKLFFGFSYEAIPHAEVRCPLAVHVWVRSAFFIGYFFVVVFACPRGVFLPGQTDVLSRLRSTSSLAIVVVRLRFCVRVPLGERSDVFPDRVCSLVLGPYTLVPLCRLSLQDRTTTTGAAGRVSRP